MDTLSAEGVNAWRLEQQHLTRRADSARWIDAVRAIGAVQAQVMSSAELAVWARVDGLPRDAVAAALWEDRTLVKTWAMRGTLHLLAREDLPLYVGARSAGKGAPAESRPASWFTYHKVTPAELEAILAGIPAALGANPLTREQLADAVAAQTGNPNLRAVLLSGWGGLLKPAAFRGDLCFGPNAGQNVTFVRPADWIGPLGPVEPAAALREVARRYLRAYGPSSSAEFGRWWGIQAGPAKRVFGDLGAELAPVEIAGWPAWALRETLPELRAAEQRAAAASSPVVRLLPAFDLYTLALYRQPFVLDAAFQPQVSRPQGWISPVVLVGGRICGVWQHEIKRGKLAVAVTPFEPLGGQARAGIDAEAERLAAFLNDAPGTLGGVEYVESQ